MYRVYKYLHENLNPKLHFRLSLELIACQKIPAQILMHETKIENSFLSRHIDSYFLSNVRNVSNDILRCFENCRVIVLVDYISNRVSIRKVSKIEVLLLETFNLPIPNVII